ncbi:TniQ family protein [Vibrio parahaemolyticus]|uniref:TniQ family protein n=1 Tax=Vibrio parahaemolyticus TaxID=670 RepID=UPI0032AEF888|nr:TniQ family protein [Vibrio parahaemolyticus]
MNGLIQLLPGEHLSAAPARWHYLGATGTLKHTLSSLGIKQGMFRPHRLFNEDDVVLEQLLTERGVINARYTYGMAAYETSFLRPAELDLLRKSSKIPQIMGVHSILPKRWRWCPDCVVEDEDLHGISYYHRDHQLAGVFHCHRHQQGLVDACYDCGYHVTNLKSQCIPPRDNTCPNCGTWMSSYDGIFTQTMAGIESASLALAHGNTEENRESSSLAIIRAHAGLKAKHENTVPERKLLTAWLDAFAAHFEPAEIRAYFQSAKVIRGTLCSPLMQHQRLFDSGTPRPPIHPLVHLMAEQFVLQDTKQCS